MDDDILTEIGKKVKLQKIIFLLKNHLKYIYTLQRSVPL